MKSNTQKKLYSDALAIRRLLVERQGVSTSERFESDLRSRDERSKGEYFESDFGMQLKLQRK